jgi:SagB-type dehydrogenase family enzyme
MNRRKKMEIMQKRVQKDPLRILHDEPIHNLSEIYHEASKLNQVNGRAYRRHIEKIIGSELFLKYLSQSYKSYPTAPVLKLPESTAPPAPPAATTLREVICKRRSVRKFTDQRLAAWEVGAILQNAYGITGQLTLPYKIVQNVRTVPSGGALYPLEIYAISFRVDDLAPAVYHYNVSENYLEKIRPGEFAEQLGPAFFLEEMFSQVGVLIAIAGVLKRSSIKYGNRAYRFMMLEAGHVGQNICLTASALNLGCVMMGGFFDGEVNQVLGLDGVNETVLYCSAVGKVEG